MIPIEKIIDLRFAPYGKNHSIKIGLVNFLETNNDGDYEISTIEKEKYIFRGTCAITFTSEEIVIS